MANTNLSENTTNNLSGLRNKFSNFSFGKMFGTENISKTSSDNSEVANRRSSASDKSPTAARNEKRTQIVNTAYYTTISEGQHKNLKKGDGLADILAKIYNLLRFQQQEDIQKGELEKNRENAAASSKRRRSRLNTVPKYSRVTKSKEKTDQYEDIIDLLMPAFKLLKGAFEGMKAIFSGILSTITGLFDVVGSLFSVLYKSIKLITSGIFKVIGGILSISKSLLGLAGTIITIITEFMFKEIIAPLTKNIMKSIVWIVNKITNNVVTDAIGQLMDLLMTVPVLGPAIKGVLAASGLYAAYQAGKELIALGTQAFIGEEAFNMIEGLQKAKEHSEAQKQMAANVGPELAKLQEQYNSAPQKDKLALSARIQNLRASRDAYDAAAKKAKDEYDIKQKAYDESKSKYRKTLDEKLAMLDLKIDENNVSRIPGKNGEKLYGLVDTKTGETYSPETSAATIETVKFLAPENISGERLKQIKDDLEKKVLESEPVKAVEKAVKDVEKDLMEITDPVINGKKLEEISKLMADVKAKIKWAVAPAEVTNITVGAPIDSSKIPETAIGINDVRNNNESVVEASRNNARLLNSQDRH
jgi:hypothetical protein